MPVMGRVGRQLKSLIWKASVDDEVDAELAFHVEMRTRELMARGMDRERAERAAVERFGDFARVRNTCKTIGHQREREMRRIEYLSELRHDVRFAIRQLAHSPGFAAVAVLTLALGIGATTAIFSTVQAVVLRPFDFQQPERVMLVSEFWQGHDGNVSAGNYVDWRDQSRTFEQLSAANYASFNLSEGETPERVFGAYVTWNFFPAFGVAPLVGRPFTADEDRPGSDHVVVLGYELWQRRFAGDRGIVGRTIRLNGAPTTVVGVMPPGFDVVNASEQLWAPIAFTPERRRMHDEHFLNVYGRLRAGATREQAQREMDGIGRQLAERYPKDDAERGVHVASLPDAIVGNYRQQLFLMLGAVALVLLIGCGNVANLLLARGAAREKEIAIRTAIGAGRGRIVRQLLTESLVLALVAAVCGVGLAWAGVHFLLAAGPPGVPRLTQTRLDPPVLMFALLTSVVSAFVFGSVPALRAARGDLQPVLKEGGRTSAFGTRDRVRSLLVVGEVALSLTLLVGAGLLVRSAWYLQRVSPGFDVDGVLSARVALPPQAYRAGAEQVTRAFEQMLSALQGSPGVRAAALSSQIPMGPGGNSNGLLAEGRAVEPKNFVVARMRMVSPGYLTTMRIPLEQGRDFTATDVRSSPLVMIVSEAAARAVWPNEDPIGKRVACCEGSPTDPRWKIVIGVAGDVRSGGPIADPTPEFYVPLEQVPPEAWDWTQRTMSIVARAERGDPTSLTASIRAAVKAVDPSLPIYSVRPMTELLRSTLAPSRSNTILLATLGITGLVLAAIGIYSVIAYFVTLRRHEIGVRMALGATSRDVLSLMTWQGLRPVLAGVLLGAAASVWATRLLQGSLYGVKAGDPMTFAGVALLLVAVSLVATLIPARRASRIDPAVVLSG